MATPAYAADFDVTVLTGNGAGSLPWAVAGANADPDLSTIAFDLEPVNGPGPWTIHIDAADLLVITESVTITGPGASALTVEADGAPFTITGPIDVEITGVTVSTTDSSVCGIDAFDATIVLDDIVANDFGCAGIAVTDGGLTATNITARNNATGILFAGSAAGSQLLSLDGVDTTGSGEGVTVHSADGVVDIKNLTSNDNGLIGVLIVVEGPDAVLTMTDTRTDNAGGLGHYITVDDGATATATRASASGSDFLGFRFEATGGAQLTVVGATATDNEGGGISAFAQESTVEIEDSLVDGNGVGCGCGGGPGIQLTVVDADVTIANTDVTNNEADTGGGINVDTFIGEDGKLVIRDSLIADNHAGFGGGGFSVDDLGLGEAAGTISILRTTISGNTAPDGGGVLIGNFSFSATGPVVTIDQSTISGNNSEAEPGLYGGGLSIYKDDAHDPGLGVVDLINSTISGNFAELGSGVYPYSDGAVTDSMSTRIRHSTIAANVGDGGVILEGVEQQLVLDHALIANNGTTDLDFIDAPELFTMAFSLVEEPGAGVTIPGGFSNQTGVDPRLGPLANNGGPTFTHSLLEGSPAFNKGNPAFVAPPSVDQRGLARVVQIIDIGAVERTVLLPATGVSVPPLAPIAALLLLAGLTFLSLRRRHV